MKKVSFDVRQFAVPVPRVGSIETHSGYGAPPLDGQEIHQIYQKKKQKEDSRYQCEKKLSRIFEKCPYAFSISGRVDGLIEDGKVLIEEIKTAFDVISLEEKLHTHHPYLLQLQTYGYIYFKEFGVLPELRLVLISSKNFRSKNVHVELDIEQYEEWMERRLEEMVVETKNKEKIYSRRIKNAETLKFPFSSPRAGQIELIEAVETHILEKKPLLVQTATGLGKTIGVLYPALKEALGRGQKVVYVTPKNSQHLVAEEAVERMQAQGAKIKSFTLTAKSKMCLKEETLCQPIYCEYANNHYAKVAQHNLIEVVTKKKKLSSKILKKMGEEFQVCPFELSLEAIESVDVVIADYNYVFSPRSLIGRLSEPLIKRDQRPNLIIDEAHNLPTRAQDYFSSTLSAAKIDQFIQFGIPQAEKVKELISSYAGEARRIEIDRKQVTSLDQEIRDFTIDYLESDGEINSGDPVLAFSQLFSDFASAIESSGPEFFHSYQKSYNDEWLKITCCDAAVELTKAYKFFNNTVAFSATLKPFNYYRELMGFSEDTSTVEFVSPFSVDNRKVMIIPQVSTKYKERQKGIPKICDVIQKVTSLKKGNYMALFPSFEFMMMTAKSLELSDYKILIQPKEIKQSVTKQFLESMKEGNPTILLGVQGGVFSEGVDYPGDMLVGAFIIGPALPHFDFEREQIKVYYEKRYGSENAFDYTYVHPAMARAVQSAGRVVRTETDRGLIILMDPRFLEKNYAQSMPSGWFTDSPEELLSTQILNDIKKFWENQT
jgi:DNA excision repair protein ERCC-2